MNFEQFSANVKAWAESRGIYEHSSKHAQALKAVSEMGELADAVIKGDRDALQDAIGDVIVCLVNLSEMSGLDINKCCESAWHEIKDRKGRMVAGGAFVKD
jgi:NTP pyrophosphatase (non-canonical NTP hydrolase)